MVSGFGGRVPFVGDLMAWQVTMAQAIADRKVKSAQPSLPVATTTPDPHI